MNDNLPSIPPEWDNPPGAERWIMYGHRSDPHKLTFYFYDRPDSEPGEQIVAAVAVNTDLAHAFARNIIDRLIDTRATENDQEGRSRPKAGATIEGKEAEKADPGVAGGLVVVGDHNAITVGDKSKAIGDNRRWTSGRRGIAALATGAVAIGGALLELLRRGSIWPF